MSNSQNILFERLTTGVVEYVAHSAIGKSSADVVFTGTFEGQPVLWRACIVALKGLPTQQSAQYIEVDQAEPTRFNIEIGLLVPVIDEPTIIKVIRMVRQYKNLARGRHEFSGVNK